MKEKKNCFVNLQPQSTTLLTSWKFVLCGCLVTKNIVDMVRHDTRAPEESWSPQTCPDPTIKTKICIFLRCRPHYDSSPKNSVFQGLLYHFRNMSLRKEMKKFYSELLTQKELIKTYFGGLLIYH